MRYPILLEPNAGPGGLRLASVVGLPVFAVRRRTAALRRVRTALRLHLEVLPEHGERPPPPLRSLPEVGELQVRRIP
jgi:hypothetical protein